MEMSALKRPKWDREDYLPRTILDACARQPRVLRDPDEASNVILERPPPLDGYPKPLSGRELKVGTFPRPEYLVDGLILKQHVNLLYGDGGVGKTVLALNAAVAIAANKSFIGRKTQQAKVLLVLAEDGNGETKYRLEAICTHYGVNLEDLPIRVWCLPGFDVSLAEIDDVGIVRPGQFLANFERSLLTHLIAFWYWIHSPILHHWMKNCGCQLMH